MPTHERLQRDRGTPEMNCWDDTRRFNVTRKGAAQSLRAYITVRPQTHFNPSSFRCKRFSCRRGTARHSKSVEILSTAAQLHDISHLRKLAIREWT